MPGAPPSCRTLRPSARPLSRAATLGPYERCWRKLPLPYWGRGQERNDAAQAAAVRGSVWAGTPMEVQPRPHPGTPGPAIDSDLLGDVNGGGEAMAARAWRAGPGEHRQAGSRVTDLNSQDAFLQQQRDHDGRAAVRPGVGAGLVRWIGAVFGRFAARRLAPL
jgi:hypothetical protein